MHACNGANKRGLCKKDVGERAFTAKAVKTNCTERQNIKGRTSKAEHNTGKGPGKRKLESRGRDSYTEGDTVSEIPTQKVTQYQRFLHRR